MCVSDSLAVYSEVPLVDPDAFRVLVLTASNDDDLEMTVDCSLSVASFADCPAYEALSYCWGNQTDSKIINVNGRALEVANNLESALRHLRRTQHERILWVDALCINQQDVRERGSQVAIMHKIYLNSTKTICWLGNDCGDGAFALDFLQWYAGRKALMHPSDVIGRHGEYVAEGWVAVVKLMKRPYWRRLWVLQEIALSRNQPFVVCGRASLPWNILLQALGDNESAYHITRLNRVRGATAELYRKGAVLNNARHIGRHVIFLLSHSSGFETTLEVDRVYALYGLLTVAGVIDFVPDYNKSASEVYQEITEFALRTKGGLDVLELRSHEQNHQYPSWIVDLSKQPPLSYPSRAKYRWERTHADDLDPTGCIRIDSELKTLTVPGAVVDEVAMASPIPPCLARAFRLAAEDPDAHLFSSDSLRASNRSALNYWEQLQDPTHDISLCKIQLEYLHRHQDIIALFFAEKLVARSYWYPRPYDWDQMLREAAPCGEYAQSGTVPESGFQKRYYTALKPLLCLLSSLLYGRCCFRTKNGYTGVGLHGTQPGDVVVAVQSSKQLHVLRPTQDHVTYVSAVVLTDSNDSSQAGHATSQLQEVLSGVQDGRVSEKQFTIW